MKPQVRNFDDLPGDARVSARTVATVMDTHVNTVWRRAKTDPNFPKPVRLSPRCTRFKVADVRAFLEGGVHVNG